MDRFGDFRTICPLNRTPGLLHEVPEERPERGRARRELRPPPGGHGHRLRLHRPRRHAPPHDQGVPPGGLEVSVLYRVIHLDGYNIPLTSLHHLAWAVGQLVATVAAHQLPEPPKPKSMGRCNHPDGSTCTKWQNTSYIRFCELFSGSSSGAPAILPFALLPRQAGGNSQKSAHTLDVWGILSLIASLQGVVWGHVHMTSAQWGKGWLMKIWPKEGKIC